MYLLIKMNENFLTSWDCFALHTWLILSSYGIIFAILSFFEDLGYLSSIKDKNPELKGILSLCIGIIFYILIGIRHLYGANRKFSKE